jgi:HSP20 family protein
MGFEDPFEEMERIISRDPLFQWPALSGSGPSFSTPMQIEPAAAGAAGKQGDNVNKQVQVQQQNQLAKAAEDQQHPQQQQLTAPFGAQWLQNYSRSPHVDVIERDSEYLVNVDVPGVQKEDLKIQISEDRRGRKLLTVSGERKEERHDQGGADPSGSRAGGWKSSHRIYGKFSRSLVLPDNCSTDEVGGRSVVAAHENGVLKISLPKVPPEQNKARVADIKIN